MLSEYVQSMDGAGTLGVILLLVSITAFALVVIRALRADRAYLRLMEQLPLDEQGGEHPSGSGRS